MLGNPRNPSALIKLYLECHRVADIWGTIPYHWYRKTQRFSIKTSLSVTLLHWKWYMVIFYTLATGIQIYMILDILSIPMFLQCMFYFIFDCIGVFTIRDQLNNAKGTVTLLNGMMDFENIHRHHLQPPRLDRRKKFCRVIARLLAYCATLLTVTGQVSFIRQPCIPIQPGFFLVERCQEKKAIANLLLPQNSVLRKIPVALLPESVVIGMLALFAFFSRTCMLNSIMTQMSLGIIIPPLCLFSYVKACEELEEKNLRAKKEKVGLEIYREIQLLVKQYNQVYRRGTISSLLYIIIMGTISMYAVVNLGSKFGLEKRLIYSYTALCMFFCGLQMYGLLGEINESSNQLLLQLKKGIHQELRSGEKMIKEIKKSKKERLYEQKVIYSLKPFKIYLGDVNYVEISTPLVTQDFIIQRTVDLSLLT